MTTNAGNINDISSDSDSSNGDFLEAINILANTNRRPGLKKLPFDPNEIDVILFDLMGTVTNWQSSISSLFAPLLHQAHCDSNNAHNLPPIGSFGTAAGSDSQAETKRKLSIELSQAWRNLFFEKAHSLASDDNKTQNVALEDIDSIHRETLEPAIERVISANSNSSGDHKELAKEVLGRMKEKIVGESDLKEEMVRGWHFQKGWPDSSSALHILKDKYILAVLANGSTRFQIDIRKHANLPFDVLLSSQLLESVKPRPEIYHKALKLVNVKPERCLMIAAHEYDLIAARDCGIQTLYVARPTEDPTLSRLSIKENPKIQAFVDAESEASPTTEKQGGLMEVVKMLMR